MRSDLLRTYVSVFSVGGLIPAWWGEQGRGETSRGKHVLQSPSSQQVGWNTIRLQLEPTEFYTSDSNIGNYIVPQTE